MFGEDFWGALTAAAAVLGLVLAFFQIRSAKSTQREAAAKEAYRSYLNLALAHPKLARGDLDSANQSPDEYYWFVSSMLFACEEVLFFSRGDKEWIETVKAQLRRHKAYLSSNLFLYTSPNRQDRFECYDKQLRLLAQAVLNEPALTPRESERVEGPIIESLRKGPAKQTGLIQGPDQQPDKLYPVSVP